jgi:hypothetical protein
VAIRLCDKNSKELLGNNFSKNGIGKVIGTILGIFLPLCCLGGFLRYKKQMNN